MWLLGIVQGLNSHPFENTDRSKNQLEALLIRTLIGLECGLTNCSTLTLTHFSFVYNFCNSFRLWSAHHHEHWLTYFINECLLLIKYLYMKLCIISKTEQMVYLASCPVITRWHFNLVFASRYDGLTLSKLDFWSTWHEFCSLVWYVSDHLFIFFQFSYIGLPYMFYEKKRVGLWLWAPGELNWTHWYIVLFTSPWFTWYCNFFD